MYEGGYMKETLKIAVAFGFYLLFVHTLEKCEKRSLR